ncbi:hypothetical protein RCH07_003671 [Arthrobacter sp. CG_A4]|nr:hypothetical protein [Arthrobacter sp. CG_A4]
MFTGGCSPERTRAMKGLQNGTVRDCGGLDTIGHTMTGRTLVEESVRPVACGWFGKRVPYPVELRRILTVPDRT